MKLLLDTHTLLWFVLGDASLSATARQLIEDAANNKLICNELDSRLFSFSVADV